MTAQEAYLLARAYTDKVAEGGGAAKGAACRIKSITEITGGHRITFEWEDNAGNVETDTMDVMDGADGTAGVGISTITYKEEDAQGNYVYTITLTSGSTYDITCPRGPQGATGATGATGADGIGITSITKTGTSGLVDTYTITYTNGTTSIFTVTNGDDADLTAGQYIEIDNDTISVKRDIARDVDAIITTSFDFPNCTVTKTIDEEVVDTVTFSMFGDIPSSVMDVYSVSFNGQVVVLTFTNTVASKEQSVGYTFQIASYSSGVIDTQTFVETLDADKKLIIQSELDSAVAGKVDKIAGKGLSTNDFTDEYKTAIGSNTSAIAAIKDGATLDSFGDVEVALLDKADTSDLGTAAAKDSTNSVTAGSTDLVESGAVKDAIDAAVAAAYHHAGTKTVAQLTHDLLIAANEGNVYNITDSGTTTSDFIEGIGKQIDAGDNVGICKVGNVYMFDLLSGLEDTSGFVRKSQTSGLLKNDGTVNTTIEDTVAGHTTAIAGKVDKANAEVTGVINNTKLPAANRQQMNVDYNNATETGWMWVGNTATIDDLELQIKSGSITVSNLLAMRSSLIKRTRITDTTSSAGTIATAIDFNRAVSAMCINGYNYYLNIRESSVGKAVVFAYELADGYQSLKPLLNTEITFDLLYV